MRLICLILYFKYTSRNKSNFLANSNQITNSNDITNNYKITDNLDKSTAYLPHEEEAPEGSVGQIFLASIFVEHMRE